MTNSGRRLKATWRHRLAVLACIPPLSLCAAQIQAQDAHTPALYKQATAPIEARIHDLMGRMTLEEKVRQLDMYAGAAALVDKHVDRLHAATDGVFQPKQAESLFGTLGVGSIHDFYPTPVQANATQKWVIAHNRLGIPVLFIEEGLLGFNTGTVFPAPLNLASTWDPDLARET